MSRRSWVYALKAVFSAVMLVYIARLVLARQGTESVAAQLGRLVWVWVAAAVAMQLGAVACSVARWRLLLQAQQIELPARFLTGSFFIARFWGAFTPGGFTGLGGWRIYDIGRVTGKTARAAAVVAVEMLLGQLAFGAVVALGSWYGLRFVGVQGVALINLGFVGVAAMALALLVKPTLIRKLAKRLPAALKPRLIQLADAVCAYEGRTRLLCGAFALGFAVHAFNNLIYVCAAKSLHVNLSPGEVFFGSSLQILSTLLPVSINGIGLREATAVALYSHVGIAKSTALLIPVVGFAVEMAVSSIGGIVFAARSSRVPSGSRVDGLPIDALPSGQPDGPRVGLGQGSTADPPTSAAMVESVIRQSPTSVVSPRRSMLADLLRNAGPMTLIGALAGSWAGCAEALAVWLQSKGHSTGWLFFYGALGYAVFGAGLGAALAVLCAWFRWPAQRLRLAGTLAAVLGLLGLPLGMFLLRRDLFKEAFAFQSAQGLALALATGLVMGLVAVAVGALARQLLIRWRTAARSRFLAAALLGVFVLAALPAWFSPDPRPLARPKGLPSASAAVNRSNVLFIVVDTMRADYMPSYGGDFFETPYLEEFESDCIRFEKAFVNASWTRPSFASMLTGMLPGSHGVMAKGDALPDSIDTLAEVLQRQGWWTAGVVTNFNVAPYFNFHQGFETYRYLEPDFVLGADDLSAKLLWLQAAKRGFERLRSWRNTVVPGTAYQDAAMVNQALLESIDAAPKNRPWFVFAGYMDPHDPYFEHPYNGRGVARAAAQHPPAQAAARMRALYRGEIRFWDRHFGALLEALKQRGLYNQTTIVVTSDHGEEFQDHGGYWHGTTLYDEQLHVPLWLKLPGSQRGGSRISHWVQSIDIAPTLLRLAGLRAPAGMQGGDLFKGTQRVYAEEDHEGNRLQSLRERDGQSAHKLIEANPGNPRGLEPVELYRVDVDPREESNIAQREQARVRSLARVMNKARVGAAAASTDRATVDVSHDPKALERLRSLGYVE